MNKFTFSFKSITTALAICLSGVAASAVDTVRQDTSSGDWVFTFNNPETNQQKVWRYVPRNQFKPIVKDGFRWAGKGQFLYSYDLRNDVRSKLAIGYMWITQARMEVKGMPLPVEIYKGEDVSEFTKWLSQKHKAFDKKHLLIKSMLKNPSDWTGDMGIHPETNIGSEFGWFASLDDAASDLAPGKTLRGAGLLRPELPGVGVMKMQGATEERGRPADFPADGPLADAMDRIEALDPIYIPVLVPAITVPVPFNSAVLANNIRQEIGYWTKLGVAKQDTIDRLNRQFDVLVPALQSNNKPTARAAAFEIYKELFNHNHGLSHHQFDQDRDDVETKSIPYKRHETHLNQSTLNEAPLNRVAARALGINMMYLMTRMEIGR